MTETEAALAALALVAATSAKEIDSAASAVFEVGVHEHAETAFILGDNLKRLSLAIVEDVRDAQA